MVMLVNQFGLIPVLLALSASILIDSDHVLNFWLWKHEISFDLKNIYEINIDQFSEYWSSTKFYMPFHSFEIVILLPTTAWFLGIEWAGLAISLGLLYHLVLDVVSLTGVHFGGDYKQAVLFYWFTYRWWKNFGSEMFCSSEKTI